MFKGHIWNEKITLFSYCCYFNRFKQFGWLGRLLMDHNINNDRPLSVLHEGAVHFNKKRVCEGVVDGSLMLHCSTATSLTGLGQAPHTTTHAWRISTHTLVCIITQTAIQTPEILPAVTAVHSVTNTHKICCKTLNTHPLSHKFRQAHTYSNSNNPSTLLSSHALPYSLT